MSRHWKPDRTRWLSDADYRSLSPQERSALHFRRSLRRHEQRYRPKPAPYRKGYYARQRWTWLAVVMAFGAVVSREGFRLPDFALPIAASASAPVTASFGYCHAGGGTNCVVDGDTFYLNGDKVRIAAIDAPETHPPRCDHEARLGEQATDKLHDLLNSGAVTMTSIDRDRDFYGRLLRDVQVDGEDVGEAMVSAGVAREYGGGRRPWCG